VEKFLKSILKNLRLNESTVSTILGALVIVIVGILIVLIVIVIVLIGRYFKKKNEMTSLGNNTKGQGPNNPPSSDGFPLKGHMIPKSSLKSAWNTK